MTQSSEQQHSNRSNVPVSSSADTAVALPKNLFHHDDDMPEWCPPYAKLQRQVVSETVRLSICGSFPRSSASRLLPPISPGRGAYSPFFTNVYGNCPMDQNAKPPVRPDSWSSWIP
ncbi:hypothetical protein JCGZ_17027 [Jatropha curcas]|uniref:Uncharacterized protein n=1 Tax=Jatropha curcas TaxID=180498 RepID=A0A067KDD9_JATCU|nr:hypothetical protein JCGZ_17027 [Jatropha curcas]